PQFLDPSFHLCADHHLIGVDSPNQHHVARMIGREEVIGRSNHEDDPKQNEETVARTHTRAPCGALVFEQNSAAEMKSRTDALRSAMCSVVNGLNPTIFCIMGALLK